MSCVRLKTIVRQTWSHLEVGIGIERVYVDVVNADLRAKRRLQEPLRQPDNAPLERSCTGAVRKRLEQIQNNTNNKASSATETT